VQRLLLGPLQHLGGGHVDLRQSRNRRGHGIPRLELGRDGGRGTDRLVHCLVCAFY
jgi:hypothetical protein